MYLKVSDNSIVYPYSIQQLKLDNPNTSFTPTISDELLKDYSVYPVEKRNKPDTDDYTKDVIEVTPILSGSTYVQTYELHDASEYTVQKRLEVQWGEVREKRNKLLSESDWTQFQDSPISDTKLTEWQTYRQTLRDITTTQTDPFDIIWPPKPS